MAGLRLRSILVTHQSKTSSPLPRLSSDHIRKMARSRLQSVPLVSEVLHGQKTHKQLAKNRGTPTLRSLFGQSPNLDQVSVLAAVASCLSNWHEIDPNAENRHRARHIPRLEPSCHSLWKFKDRTQQPQKPLHWKEFRQHAVLENTTKILGQRTPVWWTWPGGSRGTEGLGMECEDLKPLDND